MANRILLGNRSEVMGLWVSKPGFDVLTTGLNNMMMSSELKMTQVIQSGTVAINTSTQVSPVIAIPNQGFNPLIAVYTEPVAASAWATSVMFAYLSLTAIQFKWFPGGFFKPLTVTYAVIDRQFP